MLARVPWEAVSAIAAAAAAVGSLVAAGASLASIGRAARVAAEHREQEADQEHERWLGQVYAAVEEYAALPQEFEGDGYVRRVVARARLRGLLGADHSLPDAHGFAGLPLNDDFAHLFDAIAQDAMVEVRGQLAEARGIEIEWPSGWDELHANKEPGRRQPPPRQ